MPEMRGSATIAALPRSKTVSSKRQDSLCDHILGVERQMKILCEITNIATETTSTEWQEIKSSKDKQDHH
jgi:hypothetical protein